LSKGEVENQILPRTAFAYWKQYICQYWWVYFVGTVTVLFTNLMQVLSTRSVGWIVDYFTDTLNKEYFVGALKNFSSGQTFVLVFSIFIGARIFLAVGRYGWRITMARQTHIAANRLRLLLWKHVRFLPKSALDSTYTRGHLMNAANSDVSTAMSIFGFVLVGLVDIIFLGIITMVAMMFIDVSLSIYCLLAMIYLPFIVKRLADKEGKQYNIAQDELSELDDLSSQYISTMRLQKLTQTGQVWLQRLYARAEKYRSERFKAHAISLSFMPSMGSAAFLSLAVLYILGTRAVIQHEISIGDFIALLGLVSLLQDPLMGLGFVVSDWKRGMNSLARLLEIYHAPLDQSLLTSEGGTDELPGDKQVMDSPLPVLDCQSLSVQFSLTSKLLFEPLSLSLKAGERLGVMGAVGTGKSTLVNILSGLNRQHHGQVLFHGQAFSHYQHPILRKKIGVVAQKPFLFASSIRDNLCLDSTFSDDELWHFLELAQIHEDINKFPLKLDTSLGEWGINLSGGQKQRLTLARTLARMPELLFLDDCISAVDTITEERILRNLDRELKHSTLVWVAHRESTLKYCHNVISLDKGSE